MIGLALLLRLAAGVAVYIALPINGHNSPDDKAGYVFTDAHRRDDQAWQFASSGKPLWTAFDKSYYTDQYGGLLAFSAFTYRYLSPDAQRPLLIILLASLVAALGVPFLYKATRLLWDEKLAVVACWLFVLYPKSILTGGAQMREPFLLTFIAMSLWGFALWLKQGGVTIVLSGRLSLSKPAAALDQREYGRSAWLWLAARSHRHVARQSCRCLGDLAGFCRLALRARRPQKHSLAGAGCPRRDFCSRLVCSFMEF